MEETNVTGAGRGIPEKEFEALIGRVSALAPLIRALLPPLGGKGERAGWEGDGEIPPRSTPEGNIPPAVPMERKMPPPPTEEMTPHTKKGEGGGADLPLPATPVFGGLNDILSHNGGDFAGNAPPFPKGKGRRCEERERLLLSLKPYLSPARCEACDYLLHLLRLTDALRGLLQ